VRYLDQRSLGEGKTSRERCFFLHARPGAVVKNKTVAVRGKDKRNVESNSVIERLVHAVADAVVIVFCLDDGDGNIGLVIEDVIGALGLATRHELSTDDDTALGERDLLVVSALWRGLRTWSKYRAR
jgi:hypothetical protein